MSRIALIVDDEKAFLRQFANTYDSWFGKTGLEIETRTSADAARRYLRKSGDDVELIIVDIKLPTAQKGMNLLSFVQEHFPIVKRIAMTAQADREVVGRIAAAGLVDGYFEKKARDKKIRNEIRHVLDKPLDPFAHSKITEAVRRWLEQNPEAKDKEMHFMCSKDSMTICDVLTEMEKGTPFGKSMERVVFQLAWDLWLRGEEKLEPPNSQPNR